MESAHARSRLRFRIFALLFFGALGGVSWYLVSKGRTDGNTDAAVEKIEIPAPENTTPPSEGPTSGAGLAIEGSTYFKRQVTRSLKLIWLYDKDAFNFIRKYIYSVRSANKTAFAMHMGVPTVFISEANTYKSDAWCAGIIAHHAWHSYYRTASKVSAGRKGVPPPGEKAEWIENKIPNPLEFDITTLRDIKTQEAKADAFQIAVLRAVGASAAEISLIRRRDPRDLSVSHDGSYSSKP